MHACGVPRLTPQWLSRGAGQAACTLTAIWQLGGRQIEWEAGTGLKDERNDRVMPPSGRWVPCTMLLVAGLRQVDDIVHLWAGICASWSPL